MLDPPYYDKQNLFGRAVFVDCSCVRGLCLPTSMAKWKGNLASPNGDLETTMVFKVDAEKLTGTVTNTYSEGKSPKAR